MPRPGRRRSLRGNFPTISTAERWRSSTPHWAHFWIGFPLPDDSKKPSSSSWPIMESLSATTAKGLTGRSPTIRRSESLDSLGKRDSPAGIRRHRPSGRRDAHASRPARGSSTRGHRWTESEALPDGRASIRSARVLFRSAQPTSHAGLGASHRGRPGRSQAHPTPRFPSSTMSRSTRTRRRTSILRRRGS